MPVETPPPLGTTASTSSAAPTGSFTGFGPRTFEPLVDFNALAYTAPIAGRRFAVIRFLSTTAPTETSTGIGWLRLAGQSNAWKR